MSTNIINNSSPVPKNSGNISVENPLSETILREATADDWNRIRKDWLMTMRDSNFARDLFLHQTQVYWDWQRAIIDTRIINDRVDVCVWPENPSVIVGWACTNPKQNLVHFVYVLHQYQRTGLARHLLSHLDHTKEVIYTQRPDRLKPSRLPNHFVYDLRPALKGTE
jgi:GNAT superfamily N-acetyltransferase